MKGILTGICLCLPALLFGANLIPNGDLKDANGKKPQLRKFMKDGKDSPQLKTSFTAGKDSSPVILLESGVPDGTTEVNCNNITGVETGTRYYLCLRFTPLSFESGRGGRPQVMANCVTKPQQLSKLGSTTSTCAMGSQKR